jgi:hypothetical protein
MSSSTRRNRRRLAVVAILFGLAATALAQSGAVPDAERSARVYMKSFMSGDIKAAADLMDPKTLERIRTSFLSELINVGDADSEKAILANLGLARSTAELSAVDAKTLFIAITESDRRRNPQVFEAMKSARIDVLGSAPSPTGGVTVHFRIITPTGSGTSSQDSAILMRQVLGDWKVVGSVAP